MTHRSRWAALGVTISLLCLAAPAAAETRVVHRDAASEYFYDTDGLNANGYPELTDRLTRRGLVARTLLIRPRTSFVAELGESVENL